MRQAGQVFIQLIIQRGPAQRQVADQRPGAALGLAQQPALWHMLHRAMPRRLQLGPLARRYLKLTHSRIAQLCCTQESAAGASSADQEGPF